MERSKHYTELAQTGSKKSPPESIPRLYFIVAFDPSDAALLQSITAVLLVVDCWSTAGPLCKQLKIID